LIALGTTRAARDWAATTFIVLCIRSVMNKVTVYGASWCEDTQATLKDLKDLGVRYDYVEVERDPAALAWVKAQNGGKRKTPTLDIAGQVLVEPDRSALEQALRGADLMS
jgi:glutaredoxin